MLDAQGSPVVLTLAYMWKFDTPAAVVSKALEHQGEVCLVSRGDDRRAVPRTDA